MMPRGFSRARFTVCHVIAIAMLLVAAGGCAIAFKVEPEQPDECVYVSTSRGHDANGDGTRAHPVATIAHAISVAQTKMLPKVCLSGETYREQVTVVSGISIYGGFDQNDPEFPHSDEVTTHVDADGFVFDAPEIDEDTHLEGMTISASRNREAGASTYGVKLGGGRGQLFVRFNKISVEAGVDGAAGEDGKPLDVSAAPKGNPGAVGALQNPAAGGEGAAPTCAIPGGQGGHGGGSDENGQPGTDGAHNPKSGGAPGPANGCNFGVCGPPGADGQDGEDGGEGKPGDSGAPLGRIVALNYTPANGFDGAIGSNGTAGGGGGGGGGGTADFPCFGFWNEGGGGGSGGCGGKGGNFGRGGKGGGGSFGVFAAAGKITVSDNKIQTAKGGDGGRGGDSSSGQIGGAGGARGGCANDSGPGGNGGSGGSGGAGGPGGGGGGGPSTCLGHASSAHATFDKNSCTTGPPGFGGQGGTNGSGDVGKLGATGIADPTLSIP